MFVKLLPLLVVIFIVVGGSMLLAFLGGKDIETINSKEKNGKK